MKKLSAFLLVFGIFLSSQSVSAYALSREIGTPVVTTYSCTFDEGRCRVTEQTYLKNSKSYYKAACSGNRNVTRLENRAVKDVKQRNRRYCAVNL